MKNSPHTPTKLPLTNVNFVKLMPIIQKASIALGKYDGFLESLINPSILLAPITTQEAVLSSKIEGTQATLGEVLQHEAGEKYDEEKTKDIHEVLNYRKALSIAEKYLTERPLTFSLIKELHSVLLSGVRGKNMTPGKYRTEQNWIGRAGCTMEEARFVPPSPIIMHEYLENLEEFVASDYIDALIQLGVVHAQFEIIHPFNDGNGRLGRMLIPLFLYQKSVLSRPMFYLSEYLEQNREEYYDRLLAITADGDWHGWLEFFLNAIFIQAEHNTEKAKKILYLYRELKEQFQEITHSQFASTALDTFFHSPIISATDFLERSKIENRGTAHTILKKLLAEDIIIPLRQGSGQKSAIYALPRLIELADELYQS